MTWRVEHLVGSATQFHEQGVPAERTVWIFRVERPALVLGSRQPPVDVEGFEVVRRHSGGGAVVVEPTGTLWVDVVVPRGDPLWDDDVGRATYWLGDAWATALGAGAEVHRGPMRRTSLSDVVCFAGLGPGEVTLGGRKAVGISQRRTRAAARFQCVTYEAAEPFGLGIGVGSIERAERRFLAAVEEL